MSDNEVKVVDKRGKGNPLPVKDLSYKGASENHEVSWSEPRSYSITETLEGVVIETLQKHNIFDERVGYAVTTTLVPGPDGQPMPAIFLMLEAKSVVLGQKERVMSMIPLDDSAKTVIAAGIPKMLSQLAEAKAQSGVIEDA